MAALAMYIATPWMSLRMHEESINGTREGFPWGDHLWQGGPLNAL